MCHYEPQQTNHLKKTIIGFVDDKRQYTSDWINININTATINLQEVSQGWEHLLHTTGGQLELSKRAWYCISWDFTSNGLPIMIDINNHTIRIKSSAPSSIVTIKQLPITSSSKYLGVDNPPIGDQTKQLKTLLVSAQRGARIFTSSKLNHAHIGMCLNTYLFPELVTPLACSHLSTTQYQSIQQQYITSVISSMGYNKTWPVSLRYGDHKDCGLQIKHLEIEAMFRKISHLRILLFNPHISQLVLAMLAWYQHVTGFSYPVLELNPFTMDHINSLWPNDLVRLIKKIQSRIEVKKKIITQR